MTLALGLPDGASGAYFAVDELHRIGGRYAVRAMCIGVGQNTALILERV